MIRLRTFPGCVAAVLALAVLLSGCGGSAAPPPKAAPPSPSQDAATRAVTLDVLKAAGLQLVADEQAPVDTGKGLVFTRSQAEQLLAEHDAGDGILGRDIDALAPLPDGSPPMSFLVVAWLELAPTPTARAAAALTGKRSEKDARTVVFPSAVLTMFVADLAAATTPERTAKPSRAWERTSLLPIRRADDPCSESTKFLANSIDSIFRALKLTPKTSGSVFFVEWIAEVWDLAVSVAQGIVRAVVGELTEKAFGFLRTAAGIVGVAMQLRSYLRKATVTVRLRPGQSRHYRFAVDPEPDIEGSFVAEVNAGDIDWPAQLRDCAKVSGVTLPEALPAGTKVVWRLQNELGLIRLKSSDVTPLTTVREGGREKRQAVLEFYTGRESPEQAKGEEQWPSMHVLATLERKELDQLLGLVQGLLNTAVSNLTSQLPVGIRDVASGIVHQLVDPVARWLGDELKNRSRGIFTASGQGQVFVMLHKPKDPTPEPKPSKKPQPKGDFCGKYREAALWWSKQGGLSAAGEFAQRLRAIRSLGSPAQRADLDVMIKIFDLVASGASPAVIGNEVEKNDFPGAGKRLGTACGVDPSWFRMG